MFSPRARAIQAVAFTALFVPMLPVTSSRHIEDDHSPDEVEAFNRAPLLLNSAELCLKQPVFRVKDPPNSRGWMLEDDLRKHLDRLNPVRHKTINLTVDGFACAAAGCCQHTLTIRPLSTDLKVITSALQEYAGMLVKLLPWTPKKGILEGGGNIGVATALFAFLYPRVPIVVLEAEDENCMLLKKNTHRFKNVNVKCGGLWRRDNITLALVPAGRNQQWAWKVAESSQDSEEGVTAFSPQGLLEDYNLERFDFAKIDIEGSEFDIFQAKAQPDWLHATDVVAMEIHHWMGDTVSIVSLLRYKYNFHSSRHGEYHLFSKPGLLRHRVHD